MSARTTFRSRRLAMERRLAPHVDPEWTEKVLLELRLREVPGDVIGAVLAEVDSHCAESGESAVEAFGDPIAYARTLDLPTVTAGNRRELLVSLVPTGLQVIGMLAVVWTIAAYGAGEPIELTVGSLTLVAFLAVEVLLLVRFVDAILTAVVRRPVVSWLVGTVAAVVPIALLGVLRAPVAALPVWVGAVVGGSLLVVGTVGALRQAGSAAAEADPVRSPFQPEVPSRLARVVALGGVWLVPLGTVVLGLATWALAGAS